MFDSLPCAEHHWIYSLISLQIPKTASSSIAKALGQRNLIEKHISLFSAKYKYHNLFKKTFDVRHVLPEQVYSILGRQVFEYFSFAVVREPVDRLKSSYFFGKENQLWKTYKLPENITPDGYVDWLWENRVRQDILILLPQSRWTHSDIFGPTEILRFENLQDGWKNMLNKHKIKGLPETLPHSNKSSNMGEQIFSEESLDKIRELYKVDYENLKY